MNTKTAVVLGGGESSRFHPFSLIHKSLLALFGETLFLKTLKSLREAGIEDIIVVDNKNKQLFKSLSSSQIKRFRLKFVFQEDSKGMGDALSLATFYIKEKNFFVLSSYHFEFKDFKDEMLKVCERENDLVVLTKKEDNSAYFGGIESEGGKIKVYEKKEKKFERRIVSIYLLNNNFLQILSKQKKHHYNFEDAISNYKNGDVLILDVKKPTISLKFPWDILDVKDFLSKNIDKYVSQSAQIAKSAKITGKVFISKNVRVMDNAVIMGPAYIGEGSYIGTNSILRKGIYIGKNVKIGAGMELKNVVIMDGSTTHSGFIGDSIIGKNVKIAAGFITGNVRLDRKNIDVKVKNENVKTQRKYLGCIIGDNTLIGINVGTMPGVIIGSNSVIGPSSTIMKNVEDSTKYYTEFKEFIEKK